MRVEVLQGAGPFSKATGQLALLWHSLCAQLPNTFASTLSVLLAGRGPLSHAQHICVMPGLLLGSFFP